MLRLGNVWMVVPFTETEMWVRRSRRRLWQEMVRANGLAAKHTRLS